MLRGVLGRLFRLPERQTTIGAEVLGGVIALVQMAYIIVVSPVILGLGGAAGGSPTPRWL
jgi:AGZA family xanthine/uracil permease-like MFS transporter